MDEFTIVGLMIKDRIKEAGRTQKILAKYSNIVRTRLGFHELSEQTCSRVGFVILQLSGDLRSRELLLDELDAIGGVELQKMSFSY